MARQGARRQECAAEGTTGMSESRIHAEVWEEGIPPLAGYIQEVWLIVTLNFGRLESSWASGLVLPENAEQPVNFIRHILRAGNGFQHRRTQALAVAFPQPECRHFDRSLTHPQTTRRLSIGFVR